MSSSDKHILLKKNPIRFLFLMLFIGWSIIIFGIVVWLYNSFYDETIQIAKKEVFNSFEKDIVFRFWAAKHGGVYVPASEDTPPNQYLANLPERDITTPSNKKLTLMNPAYITRQLHELSLLNFGIRGHITSLNPIRKENAPDEWERAALKSFESGAAEKYGFDTINGEKYLRYMGPLETKENCLKCHSKQGYKLGDVRGGISSSIPWDYYEKAIYNQTLNVFIGFSLLWLIGNVGLFFVKKRFELYFTELNLAEKEMRKLNSEKDKLLSMVAHDLRSPFQGFLGLTSMMSTEIENFTNEELKDLGNEMNQKVNNLYLLLTDLLDWGKFQQGNLLCVAEKIDVTETTEQIIDTIIDSADRKGITITNNIKNGTFAYADKRMVRSVLRNLLSNAVKFTSYGGQISLDAKKVEGVMIECTIADTGIGIPEDMLHKLFTDERHEGREGTKGEESYGLGLSLCKELVEKNGGTIRAKSEELKGSEFYFTLPEHTVD